MWTAERPADASRVVQPPGLHGTVSEAVAADLDALMTPHPMADGLRAVALSLAGQLDVAEPRFAGGLARELRATLTSLASYPAAGTGPDEDAIDLGAEYT